MRSVKNLSSGLIRVREMLGFMTFALSQNPVCSIVPSSKLTGEPDANDFVRNFYSHDIEIYECFFILLLNRSNTTIGYAKISQGDIVGTVIDTTIIAMYCVKALAKSVILCHNHPSGTLFLSEADKVITKKIAEL